MYHEVTSKERKRRRTRTVVVVLVILAVAAALVFGTQVLSKSTREQGATALRQSILDAALRCCAIEGSYPLSLSHLEKDYGLRINHNDYIITYEAYASNIAPSVVVVPR